MTFNNEKSQQEYDALKIATYHKKLPRELYLLEDTPPQIMKKVQDGTIRDELMHNYKKIIDQAKYDLTHVLIRAATVIKDDCQRVFNTELEKVWSEQRRLSSEGRLSTTLLTLIEERQENIVQTVKQIYQLKMDFFSHIPISVLKQARTQ